VYVFTNVSTDKTKKGNIKFKVIPKGFKIKKFWEIIFLVIFAPLWLPFFIIGKIFTYLWRYFFYYIWRYSFYYIWNYFFKYFFGFIYYTLAFLVVGPFVLILFLAVSPFLLIYYFFNWLIKTVYQKYKNFVGKFLISSIRIKISNPLLSGSYLLYNAFLKTPPLLNIISFAALISTAIPFILGYSIQRYIRERLIFPVAEKVFLEKRQSYQDLTIMDLINKKYDTILENPMIIANLSARYIADSAKQALQENPLLLIHTYIRDFESFLYLQAHVKRQELSLEELNRIRELLESSVENSQRFSEMLQVHIMEEKHSIEDERKRKFDLKDKKYKTKFFLKTWYNVFKLRIKHSNNKRSGISLTRSCIADSRQYQGTLRDIKILSSHHLKKITQFIHKNYT